MPYVSGFLIDGPVDPGFGRPGGGRPGSVDPGYGIDLGAGIDNTLPTPPPGVFPPLTPSHPIAPAPPGTPPGTIWPPLWSPVDPGYGHGGVMPPHVSTGPVPTPPVTPGTPPPRPTPAPIPPRPDQGLPSQTYWVVVGVPGVGWRYCAIDPSLVAGMPLPEAPPARPDNTLPPTAEPRRG